MKDIHKDLTIMLVAVEPSADLLGARLYQDLKSHKGLLDHYDSLEILGCGGALMEKAGFESRFSIDALSVMGFTDVARAYPEARRRIKELSRLCATRQVDAVVFIDGWAFSRLGAKAIRRVSPDTKVYKFVAPTIWAWRPERVHFVKQYFDGVLTVLPFEKPLFEAEGIKTEYVGNPIFQHTFNNLGNGEKFKTRHGLDGECVLTVLPGSRRSELKHLKKPFEETINLLRKKIENLSVIMPIAPALEDIIKEQSEFWSGVTIVKSAEKYDAFAASDISLASSGTVTTELAIHKTPMVISYKVDPLTAVWARRKLNIRFASILNNMADQEIIPEFVQENCDPIKMADALATLYHQPEVRAQQIRLVGEQLDKLSLDAIPASQKAANILVQWICQK